ncbi:T9SS type A sorting domain-containing protein, partial [bacterium]|nr:T9SS type A sorting domain-containing protein [bacterium]
WTVEAYDGDLYRSANGAPYSFTLSANAEPPADFMLTMPIDSTYVPRNEVVFQWEGSEDPEGAMVRYRLEITIGDELFTTETVIADTMFGYDFSGIGNLPEDPIYGTWTVFAMDTHFETEASNGPQYFVLEEPVAVDEQGDETAPSTFALQPARPNPFNAQTMLRYHLPRAGRVSLKIYDVLGRPVRDLVEGSRNPGSHELVWDGRSEDGVPLSTGVYFVRFIVQTHEGPAARDVQKLLLVK